MNCPCKNCENKGCGSYHDICKQYLTWSAERTKHRELEQQNKRDEFYFKNINIRNNRRLRDGRHKNTII